MYLNLLRPFLDLRQRSALIELLHHCHFAPTLTLDYGFIIVQVLLQIFTFSHFVAIPRSPTLDQAPQSPVKVGERDPLPLLL